MNIQILDSWLREYLKTDATPDKIAECVSLCGPSFEKIEKVKDDYVYDIEITTNRVDCMSVIGIARECAAILPQFGISATFVEPKFTSSDAKSTINSISIKDEGTKTKRVMAVVMSGVKNYKSPEWMIRRLEASNIRSLNAVIDITNYVMTEIGHPTHVFDYDKLVSKKLIFRKSKKGEKLVTLDGKTHTLLGDDIVIDDGNGEIIDLPGIMGTKNSVVDENTKNILFFIDNNDEIQIRKTSMGLAIRTVAATLNEKGVDPELAKIALNRGIELYQEIAKAEISSKIYDIYPKVYKLKSIKVSKSDIDKKLGVNVSDSIITKSLKVLGFNVEKTKEIYNISIPSYRSRDIEIKEDIVEEVARIYGYHNLPSVLPYGDIPQEPTNSPFKFEKRVKNILYGLGGYETYTSSLVDKSLIDGAPSLKLKNPLGEEGEYLRTSLIPSLVNASNENKLTKDPYFLYEIANVYYPQNKNLPKEVSKLGIIFVNFEYRVAKGIIEELLNKLNIKFSLKYLNDQKLELNIEGKISGEINIAEQSSQITCEFDTYLLMINSKTWKAYIPNSKYPGQTEDYTFEIKRMVKVVDVIDTIYKSNKLIKLVELSDIYENNYTFTVTYHDDTKTLTDSEVTKIREEMLKNLKSSFGITQKE